MVKIKDVARHARVSPSTISYALSGKRPISDETRKRIEASIRKLGYLPHAGARALASSRSNVLALMIPLRTGVHVPVIMQFLVSVVTTARGHRHDVLLLTQDEGEEGLRRVAGTSLVDGILVMDVELNDPRLPFLRNLDIPSVLIGFPADPAGLTCIDLDFEAAGELCAEQLALLGHRSVALVGSPPQVYQRETGFAQRVARGFSAACERHGLLYSVHACEPTAQAARELAQRLLYENPRLTGLIIHNEGIARSLMESFEKLGRTIPRDLSVIGICPDDEAEQMPVPLSSVSLPASEIASRAVTLLMYKLENPESSSVPEATLLTPRLTLRESTGPR